jgi:hypothetical protein
MHVALLTVSLHGIEGTSEAAAADPAGCPQVACVSLYMSRWFSILVMPSRSILALICAAACRLEWCTMRMRRPYSVLSIVR